jgi:hypothetical protein
VAGSTTRQQQQQQQQQQRQLLSATAPASAGFYGKTLRTSTATTTPSPDTLVAELLERVGSSAAAKGLSPAMIARIKQKMAGRSEKALQAQQGQQKRSEEDVQAQRQREAARRDQQARHARRVTLGLCVYGDDGTTDSSISGSDIGPPPAFDTGDGSGSHDISAGESTERMYDSMEHPPAGAWGAEAWGARTSLPLQTRQQPKRRPTSRRFVEPSVDFLRTVTDAGHRRHRHQPQQADDKLRRVIGGDAKGKWGKLRAVRLAQDAARGGPSRGGGLLLGR